MKPAGQPPSLAEAIARAQLAYVRLDERIQEASRRFTELQLLKPRVVAALGFDPTAEPYHSQLVHQEAAAQGLPQWSHPAVKQEPAAAAAAYQPQAYPSAPYQPHAYPAAHAYAPVPAAAAPPHPSAAVQPGRRQPAVKVEGGGPSEHPPRPGRQRGAGGSADGMPSSACAAASTASKPAAAPVASAAAAAATAAAGTEAAVPAAAAGGGRVGGSGPGTGRFHLATSASGKPKLKLTPWQALKKRAAAGTEGSELADPAQQHQQVSPSPSPRVQQAQQQQQQQQQAQQQAQQHQQVSPSLSPRAQQAQQQQQQAGAMGSRGGAGAAGGRLIGKHAREPEGAGAAASEEEEEDVPLAKRQRMLQQRRQHVQQPKQPPAKQTKKVQPPKQQQKQRQQPQQQAPQPQQRRQQQPVPPNEELPDAELRPAADEALPAAAPRQQDGSPPEEVNLLESSSAGSSDACTGEEGSSGEEGSAFESGSDGEAAAPQPQPAQPRQQEQPAARGGRPPLPPAAAGVGPGRPGKQQKGGVKGGESSAAAREGTPAAGSEGSPSGGSSGAAAAAPAAAAAFDRGGSAGGSAGGSSDGGLHFEDPEAARQFRQHFNSPDARDGRGQRGGRGRGRGQAGGKRAASGAAAARPSKRASPGDRTAQTAWEQAAAAWRQKNMPSKAEIRKAVKDHAAASAAYQANKQKRTPMDHVAVERGKRRPGPAERAAAARRAEEAAADSRARARTACRRKIEGCSSFVQLLRIFGVPTDPARLRDAYRTAVRMYHPDSNSKDRAWQTEEEKYEAEEVMKIINERKPADL